jgi:hypothetical protein
MAAKKPTFDPSQMDLTLSAGEAKDFIKTFVNTSREAIMIWGGPGIGKSSIVHQLKTELGCSSIIDLRLATLDATTVGGIPARHPNHPELMTMLRPDFYPEIENSILFLDEFSNCPPAIQNVALQILLDKRVHTHQLPESTIVIAAGNRAQDGAWVNRLSLPAANRMKHLTVIPRWEDVRAYFKGNTNVSQFVVSFLDSRPDLLYDLPKDPNQMCFPTPRSWEHFANSLQGLSDSGNLMMSTVTKLAVSTVGRACALEFENFMALAHKISAEDVVEKGKIPELPPGDPGFLFAACGAVTNYFLTKCGTKTRKLTENQVTNMFDFLEKLPVEYRTATFKDMNWLKNKSHFEACRKHEFTRFQAMSNNIRDILVG